MVVRDPLPTVSTGDEFGKKQLFLCQKAAGTGKEKKERRKKTAQAGEEKQKNRTIPGHVTSKRTGCLTKTGLFSDPVNSRLPCCPLQKQGGPLFFMHGCKHLHSQPFVDSNTAFLLFPLKDTRKNNSALRSE